MGRKTQTTSALILSFLRALVPVRRVRISDVMRAAIMAVFVVAIGFVALFCVLLLLYVMGSFFDRSVWDLLKVLAVPLTLGVAVPLLNRSQKKRELEVEAQRAQDQALEAYLEHMSQMLTAKTTSLSAAKLGDPLSTVARARTLTVLPRLDGARKGSVLKFLRESALISKGRRIISLVEADLSRANLEGANLYGADLSETILSGAILRDARLEEAALIKADLQGADLSDARLMEADLAYAQLGKAKLIGAKLGGLQGDTFPEGRKSEWMMMVDNIGDLARAIDIRGGWENTPPKGKVGLPKDDASSQDRSSRPDASQDPANPVQLDHADLSKADLFGATVGDKLLQEIANSAASLEGATMPNGQKYEDWRKSKIRGEEVEKPKGR